jgi:hypothetical protein
MKRVRVALVSDLHYAGPLERARGNDYGYRELRNPLLRGLARAYGRHVWLRDPLDLGYLLHKFLEASTTADYAIANGDYSCDSAAIGVSDDAAFESVGACLGAIRKQFGTRTAFTYGDHELGKLSLAGARGGMRLASFHRANQDLELPPLWRLDLGRYTLIGVVSSLVGLPVFSRDALSSELPEWELIRRAHMAAIATEFARLSPNQRVLLFCHDPTALPFLWREEAVRQRISQVEHTFIGHLHSNLILWQSRLLAGMPTINFLGPTARRLSLALGEARHWRHFKVRLCPAIAGLELLKDGGFLWLEIDPEGVEPLGVTCERIPR